MKKIIALSIVLISLHVYSQKIEGLAKTPPMGWNSWNTFETNINEELIIGMVDSIISKGLKDAGYTYIVLDDGWMARERDAQGNLVADPVKFPKGMKHLADYVHSKGMKFGLYNCAGKLTCAGYPGSRGHEYQDARLYASWGVDFLKYDWCYTDKLNAEEAYITMRDALYATGRPIVFSICEWGNNEPWKWGAPVGNLWRVTGDITNCFDCEVNHGTWSSWGVMKIVYLRDDIRQYTKPDAWNDYDMMEVGNGMTAGEDRAHFALWSIFASPLIMGNDVRNASKETIEILSNKEVIGINQDPLGIHGFKYMEQDSLEVWVKPLQNDAWALCFLNRNTHAYSLDFDWNTHTIIDSVFNKKIQFSQGVYTIRNVYTKKDIGTTKKILQTTIPAHDVLYVVVSKKS